VDFALGETQEAVATLAARVLGHGRGQDQDGPGQDRPDPRPPLPDGYDRALWQELGQAGLLSLALPPWLGGDALGVLDSAVLLTEVGKQAAPVPALATLLLGVLPITRWGSRDLQQELLADVAAGDTVLTAAIREPSDPMPAAPAATASWSGGSGTVSGVKIGVPYAAAAARILVPASIASGGTGVVIIDPTADGVSMRQTPSSAGGPEWTLRLDDAPVTGLLGTAAGGQVVQDLHQLALAGACCVADGALSAALALTTTYTGSREQFSRPLAAFQAVSQQIADVYVVARTLHLATLSACWRLEAGREAADDLDVAAYWLARHAPAALRSCHHLHGGIGMDVSYPLHRYSSLVKDMVRFVGGADYRLDVLRPGIIE
jgi:3-oxo-4-pregnene-20-carboxyl-CoA dehydrogenase alpha subunit